MSRQNKLRFLLCLLFSAVAHSGVLIASMMMGSQIQEDPQGASEKLATKAPGVAVAKNSIPQLPTVLPSKKAHSEQTLELVDLPTEKPQILLAKDDDPQAVEIEKPKPQRPIVKAIKPKVEPKKKKQTKVAKLALPKKSKKSDDSPISKSDEKLVAVKEKVDAEPNETVAEEPISDTPPVASEDPQVETEAAAEAQPENQSEAQGTSQEDIGGGTSESAQQAPVASLGGNSKGIRDGDSLAEMSGNRRPNYPIEDRRAKREGIAVFTARITAEGRVQDIKLESSATPAMNAAAQKAFANYRYKPGQEGRIRKKFVFKINGELEEAGGLRRIPDRNSQKTSQN